MIITIKHKDGSKHNLVITGKGFERKVKVSHFGADGYYNAGASFDTDSNIDEINKVLELENLQPIN